jgi:hypothetical protein
VNARSRTAVLAGCLVVVLALAWYAGARPPTGTAASPAGTVRLGPEPGEDVDAYLDRLPAALPPAGVRAPALVQLDAEATTPDALDAVAGTTLVTAVFRVPLPRVQTALRFVDLEPGVPAATALDTARARAQLAAAADAGRLPGRAGAVATAEAAALAAADCRCVVAVLVDDDRAALDAVAARPQVRAVDAAPPGTAKPALAPLLPGQATRADPLPDDGPVPAR